MNLKLLIITRLRRIKEMMMEIIFCSSREINRFVTVQPVLKEPGIQPPSPIF